MTVGVLRKMLFDVLVVATKHFSVHTGFELYALRITRWCRGRGIIGVSEYDTFVTGWLIIPSVAPAVQVWTEHTMDHAESVGKWEAVEICPGWENTVGMLTGIFKNVGRRVHNRWVITTAPFTTFARLM